MEAQYSQSSSSLPDGLKQQHSFHQEPSNAHQPPSESSQAYTQAPSSTGDGATGKSVEKCSTVQYVGRWDHTSDAIRTSSTESGEPNHDQIALAHQHRPALTPDRHDFSHAGGWATEPHADTFVIENDPILSPIHRAGADMNAANRENTASVGNENVDEAVELLRASLHRKVPKE